MNNGALGVRYSLPQMMCLPMRKAGLYPSRAGGSAVMTYSGPDVCFKLLLQVSAKTPPASPKGGGGAVRPQLSFAVGAQKSARARNSIN